MGWTTRTSLVESGMPGAVASVFANALVKCALVTFPTHTLQRRNSFFHTRRPDDVQGAFNAEFFNWSLRGQVIFLSPVEAKPPALSSKHLDLANNAKQLSKLADVGVTGVVLPGVDGDVAGIYTFSDDFLQDLLSQLKSECERAGAQWREVTEVQFFETL
ncbi:hypothetical protein [Paraburkholderia sp.]|uniref:hypothetical protein n=1 Tax=Paraburkholderia sp. TaxID=1926495 RepID=UPI003C6207F0